MREVSGTWAPGKAGTYGKPCLESTTGGAEASLRLSQGSSPAARNSSSLDHQAARTGTSEPIRRRPCWQVGCADSVPASGMFTLSQLCPVRSHPEHTLSPPSPTVHTTDCPYLSPSSDDMLGWSSAHFKCMYSDSGTQLYATEGSDSPFLGA